MEQRRRTRAGVIRRYKKNGVRRVGVAHCTAVMAALGGEYSGRDTKQEAGRQKKDGHGPAWQERVQSLLVRASSLLKAPGRLFLIFDWDGVAWSVLA